MKTSGALRGKQTGLAAMLVVAAHLMTGCQSTRQQTSAARPVAVAERSPVSASVADLGDALSAREDAPDASEQAIHLAAHLPETEPEESDILSAPPAPEAPTADNLDAFIGVALQANPRLRRLAQEAAAAFQRVPQVRSLPDPMLSVNGFGEPIETAAGSQRANMAFSQRIPWLKRLDAQGRQATYEAWMLQEMYEAERLKIVADVKEVYDRLYVLGQQVRINRETQDLLKSLLEVANERVRAGAATQGDVLAAALELSRLTEELVSLEQRLTSAKARLNELLNRPAYSPVPVPEQLIASLPESSIDGLRQRAFEYQPEITAARMKRQATSWGIEAASLARIPDLTLSFGWFFMDDNRPPSAVVDVGEDAWSIGAGVNIPLWRDKYNAMESEAVYRHSAASLVRS